MSLVMLDQTNTPAARAYRALRANVLLELGATAPAALMVAGVDDRVDSMALAANLALALAQAEKRVVLIDAHLHQPTCHALFGLAASPGLSEYLRDLQMQPPLQPVQPCSFLHVITAGDPQGDPSDVLSSPRTVQALSALRAVADLLVLHAPPLASFPEAALLATHVEGVVLAVGAGRSHRDHARRAQDLLTRAGARLLGAVLMH